MTSQIQRACSKQIYNDIKIALKKHNNIFAAIERYVQWGKEGNKLPSDSIEDLISRVDQYRKNVKILD